MPQKDSAPPTPPNKPPEPVDEAFEQAKRAAHGLVDMPPVAREAYEQSLFEDMAETIVSQNAHNAKLAYENKRAGDTLASVARFALKKDETIEKLEQAEEEASRQAMIDPLTELPNRRALELMYHQMYGHALRMPDEQLAVLFADLDKFKEVNDNFGHGTGDALLKVAAGVLLENLREQDVVGRTGGEEFVALLPNTTIKDAVAVAERLRKGIEGISSVGDRKLHTTISIGVGLAAHEDFTIGVEPADRAMYRAKQLGRNRIEIAE